MADAGSLSYALAGVLFLTGQVWFGGLAALLVALILWPWARRNRPRSVDPASIDPRALPEAAASERPSA